MNRTSKKEKKNIKTAATSEDGNMNRCPPVSRLHRKHARAWRSVESQVVCGPLLQQTPLTNRLGPGIPVSGGLLGFFFWG